MNRSVMLFVLLLTVTEISHAANDGPFPDWLAGCWEQRKGDVVYQEQWMAPAAGMMLGMSRMMNAGVLLEFEFLRIARADGDAEIQYIALPSGQVETAFTLTLAKGRRLTFENPEHDFPQKISYVLRDEILTAIVEGESDGEARQFQIAMRKVSCE